MAINFQAPDHTPVVQTGPRISVIGVGGAGGNAVNNMIQSALEGVEFVVANTDAQALGQSRADHRIQLGANLTSGLGAGSKPEIGRDAAYESIEEIMTQISGSNMCFITAGMGGGTGTGAAPVIAHAAREAGILTVGVVTKPFQFEGAHRMRLAEAGIEELQKYVDTLIVIPNQNLFRIANENTTFAQAFQMADEVLHSGVRGVTDLMVRPGMINLDFSDIKTVMSEMGKAMMGTGTAEGERRAIEAAESAISNPLLDDTSMKGARGVLINITGGMDIALFEVDEAVNRIRQEVDPDANIIFGTTLDESTDGIMRVSVVATGIDAIEMEQPEPTLLDHTEEEVQQPVQMQPAQPKAQSAQGIAAKVLAMQSAQRAQHQPQSAPVQQELDVEDEMVEQAVAAQANASKAEQVAMRIQRTMQSAPAQQQQQQRMVQPQQRPAFIPPVAQQVEETEQPMTAQNPFKEQVAEQTRNDAPRQRSRSMSLFDRVTGRGQRDEKAASPAQVHEFGQQPSMNVSAGEPPVTSQSSENDLLDIPAFLRRQAN